MAEAGFFETLEAHRQAASARQGARASVPQGPRRATGPFALGTGFDGVPRFRKNRTGAAPEPLQKRLLALAESEPQPTMAENNVGLAWGAPARYEHSLGGALAASRERIETGVTPVSPGGLRSVEQIRADRVARDEAAEVARTARGDQLRAYAARRGDVENVMTVDELLDPEFDDLVSWDVA